MSRLGRINDEILSVYNTYNTPELHDKILEFLQKDLPDKMESYLEKKRRFENLELSSSASSSACSSTCSIIIIRFIICNINSDILRRRV